MSWPSVGTPALPSGGEGVDAELFNPSRRDAEMRRLLTGGETDKPLVIYVGRLAREKRLLDLYEAARQLPDVRFAVVGDGPEREALERRFAGVPTVFTGFLRGERLAQAFAAAEVFAFPSESETFGQVVLQAMASGVPPIVVRGTAPAEFVRRRGETARSAALSGGDRTRDQGPGGVGAPGAAWLGVRFAVSQAPGVDSTSVSLALA